MPQIIYLLILICLFSNTYSQTKPNYFLILSESDSRCFIDTIRVNSLGKDIYCFGYYLDCYDTLEGGVVEKYEGKVSFSAINLDSSKVLKSISLGDGDVVKGRRKLQKVIKQNGLVEFYYELYNYNVFVALKRKGFYQLIPVTFPCKSYPREMGDKNFKWSEKWGG